MVLNYLQIELRTARGPVAGCCEHADELSGSKQGSKIFWGVAEQLLVSHGLCQQLAALDA